VLALGCALTHIMDEVPNRFEHYFMALTAFSFATFVVSLLKLAETRKKRN